MSKAEKTVEITLEQATEAVALKKEDVRAAKAELKAFRKEHKLKPDDVPGEEKVIKGLAKLEKRLAAAEAELETATEVLKGLKPTVVRETKYEFPEDCVTPADRKKFRAKKRREAKKAAADAEALANGTEAPVKEKKSKKTEAAAEEAPVEEAPKKKKKATADED